MMETLGRVARLLGLHSVGSPGRLNREGERSERQGMLRRILIICTLNVVVLVTLLGVSFLALEAYLRIRPVMSPYDPWGSLANNANALYDHDSETGWALKANLRFEFQRKDAAGAQFRASFATNESGWVGWGDRTSDRPRLLFVGDSFTADTFVSNADAYYSVVKRKLDVEVFAMGASGFGTLQELILLERSYRAIRPDVVILQFCANDFENNSVELEARTANRSQRFNRPYYINNGRIFPGQYASFYRLLIDRSRAFSLLDRSWSVVEQQYFKPTVMSDVFDTAERITVDLFKQIRATAKEAQAVATFNCFSEVSDQLGSDVTPGSKDVGLTKRWERSARAVGFETWPEIARSVDDSESEGAVVRMADGAHWNRLGHEIAGNALAKRLRPLLTLGEDGSH